jgi:hypothetical protein
MPKMCTFTRKSDPAVSVNPLLVRTVVDAGDGYTRIAFDKDHSVTVFVPWTQVITDLGAAME